MDENLNNHQAHDIYTVWPCKTLWISSNVAVKHCGKEYVCDVSEHNKSKLSSASRALCCATAFSQAIILVHSLVLGETLIRY